MRCFADTELVGDPCCQYCGARYYRDDGNAKETLTPRMARALRELVAAVDEDEGEYLDAAMDCAKLLTPDECAAIGRAAEED